MVINAKSVTFSCFSSHSHQKKPTSPLKPLY